MSLFTNLFYVLIAETATGMSEHSRKKCCNPYGIHTKAIRNRLEPAVPENLPERYKHFAGCSICENCRGRAKKEAEKEAEDNAAGSLNYFIF